MVWGNDRHLRLALLSCRECFERFIEISCYLQTNVFIKAPLWKDNATSYAHWQSLELISLPAFIPETIFEVGKIGESIGDMARKSLAESHKDDWRTWASPRGREVESPGAV